MNVERLLDVKAHILAEPDKFRMDTWSCGTAHCIAGWACLLAGDPVVNPEQGTWNQHTSSGAWPGTAAEEWLELQDGCLLFDIDGWPDDLAARYHDAARYSERAQVAAERIDRYVATGGRE